MERLTYKTYIEEYEVNFEKNSEKQWSIAESDTHIKVTGEPIDKLGQLEDALEKYGIESVKQLEQVLNWLSSLTGRDAEEMLFICQERKNIFERINFVSKENTELKEKLKNAIMPKFNAGQDIFFIDNEYQITQGVVDIILIGQDVFEKWCKYSIDLGTEYEYDIRFVDKDEEEIFATEEEARKRLEELKGE